MVRNGLVVGRCLVRPGYVGGPAFKQSLLKISSALIYLLTEWIFISDPAHLFQIVSLVD